MARPALRVINTDGELVEPESCPRCQEVEVGDLEIIQRENAKLKRRIRSLERDQEAQRMADPNRAVILYLIERWKKATNHPKSNANAADRFDVVKARLREGYTPAQLELAIDGIGAFPYVHMGERVPTGKPSEKHDRLGIALGSGENVERFANLGHQAKRNG